MCMKTMGYNSIEEVESKTKRLRCKFLYKVIPKVVYENKKLWRIRKKSLIGT